MILDQKLIQILMQPTQPSFKAMAPPVLQCPLQYGQRLGLPIENARPTECQDADSLWGPLHPGKQPAGTS